MQPDYLVIGAGLFGAVCAERIANHLGATVVVMDRRSHIGGLCHSEIDQATGIKIHAYGTHVFHTSSQKVWDYCTKFTQFNGYHHQVLTKHKNTVYQMPINLETINAHFGTSFTPQEACDFIRAEIAKEHIASPANFEEAAISQVGRALYEAFIKGYSLKQWGRPPHELPASLFGRMPVRFDYREDYFVNCRWQGLPLKGYAGLFKAFLSSPKIQTVCGQSWTPGNGDVVPQRQTIFTGALDELYNYRFGPLEWRSVRFDRSVLDMRDFQGTAVMNYADASVEWTRIHEPRHLHSERAYPDDRTVIIRETPEANATDRFYPVSTRENLEKLERYRALAAQDRTLVVGGRLGAYRYLDMDAAILSALECYETTIYPSAGA